MSDEKYYEMSLAELVLTQRDEAREDVKKAYEWLKDKEWTVDKLREHCREIYAELQKKLADAADKQAVMAALDHLNKLATGELP